MDDLIELQALSWKRIFTLAEGLTCEANTLHLQGEHRNCFYTVPATLTEVDKSTAHRLPTLPAAASQDEALEQGPQEGALLRTQG